jgi:hypothetical protein
MRVKSRFYVIDLVADRLSLRRQQSSGAITKTSHAPTTTGRKNTTIQEAYRQLIPGSARDVAIR